MEVFKYGLAFHPHENVSELVPYKVAFSIVFNRTPWTAKTNENVYV